MDSESDAMDDFQSSKSSGGFIKATERTMLQKAAATKVEESKKKVEEEYAKKRKEVDDARAVGAYEPIKLENIIKLGEKALAMTKKYDADAGNADAIHELKKSGRVSTNCTQFANVFFVSASDVALSVIFPVVGVFR